MLLKNFGALLATALTNNVLTEGLKCSTGELPKARALLVMSRNSGLYSVIDSSVYAANLSSNSNSKWAFGFGTGTTPPTIDDYKLSGYLVTPTLVDSDGTTYNGSNGSIFQMVVCNETQQAMTINEIGLFITVDTSGCVMLTRDVLPQPVVLQQGESNGFQIYIDTQSFISNAAQA